MLRSSYAYTNITNKHEHPNKTIENTNKTKVRPSQIDMFQEIKKIGSYKAKINLHAEVQAIIHIEVVKEEDKHKS